MASNQNSEMLSVMEAQVDTDVKGADVKTITKNVKEKMSKTIENTREAMGAIRTGRPSPNIFDKVKRKSDVTYSGCDVISGHILGHANRGFVVRNTH